MVDQNESIAREVDEELRREQFAKLWEQYGVYAMLAAAALVFGIGGWKWVEQRRLTAAQALGARYEVAQTLAEDGKADDARKAFEAIAKDQPSGYQVLARMRVAGDLAKAGKRDDAVAAYDGLAKQEGADPLLTSFAALQAATLRAGTGDWTEMQNRLNVLALEKSAWRHSARELLGIEALRHGKLDEARQSLEQLLGDRQVPQGIAKRAQDLMAMLTAMQLTGAKPAPSPEGAAGTPVRTSPGKADDSKSKQK